MVLPYMCPEASLNPIAFSHNLPIYRKHPYRQICRFPLSSLPYRRHSESEPTILILAARQFYRHNGLDRFHICYRRKYLLHQRCHRSCLGTILLWIPLHDTLRGGIGEFARRMESALNFPRGYLEDPGLGFLQDLRRAFLSFTAPAHQLVRQLDNCLAVAFSRTVFA